MPMPEDQIPDAPIWLKAAVCTAIAVAGLIVAIGVKSEIDFENSPPGAQCWHGVMIGSNDRC